MSRSSSVLKFHKKDSLADLGFGQTPVVVFFGVPESVFFEMTGALVQAGFKPLLANSHAQVSQVLANPAFRVGVVMDRGIRDPLSFIQIGRKISHAKWILITQEQSNAFRAKALAGVKVDGLFDYPLIPARILSKIRQLNEALEAENGFVHGVPPAATVVVPGFKLIPAPGTGPTSVESLDSLHKVGLDTIPTGDASFHRPKWPQLSDEAFMKASGNAVLLQSLLDEALINVVRDLKQFSRVSLVTFGMNQPYFEGVPEEFVVLSSSDEVDRRLKYQSVKTAQYPEMLEALRTGRPILARDVRESPLFESMMEKIDKVGTYSLAAIPLYHGNRPFGLLKARLKDASTNQALGVLADLTAYSRDLSRFAMQSAFFQRIYRPYYATRAKNESDPT